MTNYSNERPFDSGHSPLSLTPSQRLALIERSQALTRRRRKATAKVFGIAFLMFASGILFAAHYGELVVGALVLGVIVATAAIWGGFSDPSRVLEAPSKPEIDPHSLKDLDQRLANLETILGYEEKIAARNRHLENAQD